MAHTASRDLFDRYVNGAVTAAEAVAFRQWLAEPAHQLLVQYWMQQHWEELNVAAAAPRLLGEPDFEAILTALHARMGVEMPELTAQKDAAPVVPMRALPAAQPGHVVPMWRRFAAAAAIVGTLAGGVWMARSYLQHAPVAVATTTTYSTPYGKTRTVSLPDGSRVTLNANSTLRYTAPAGDQPREAWLDGEGFFEVQHTADNRRFLVHTAAGLNVEVLGTRFSVYRRRAQARVVLVSGKVRVSFADDLKAAVVMKPGDVVETHTGETQAVIRRTVPQPEVYSAWKDGKLVLSETTIGELSARLQDTYGLRVEVGNPALNERRITGTVSIRDLDVLLLALQESFNLNVKREPGRIILSETRPSSSPQ